MIISGQLLHHVFKKAKHAIENEDPLPEQYQKLKLEFMCVTKRNNFHQIGPIFFTAM